MNLPDIKEIRRKQILEAAIKCFSEHGFYQTTMETVAKEANLAKGTLYIYFKNKKALILEMFNYISDEAAAESENMISGETKSPLEKIEAVLDFVFNFMENNHNWQKLIPKIYIYWSELLQDSNVIDFAKRKNDFYDKLIAGIIKEGIETGDFRKMDKYKAAVLINSVIVGLSIAINVLNSGTLSEYKQDLKDFVINAIKKKNKSYKKDNP